MPLCAFHTRIRLMVMAIAKADEVADELLE